MSYNNIGLQTARGSGTNGYIQRNLSHVRPRDDAYGKGGGRGGSGYGGADDFRRREGERAQHRQPDEGILEHERKRKIEVRCMELQVELEDKEVEEDEIVRHVAALREKLTAQAASAAASSRDQYGAPARASYGGYTRQEAKAMRPSDTHAWGAAKAGETENLSRALGIRQGYREGDAFDRELQENLKMERIEERRRRDEERVKAAEERQREAEMRRKRRLEEEEDRRRFDEEAHANAARRRRYEDDDRRDQYSFRHRTSPDDRDGSLSPARAPRRRSLWGRSDSRSLSPVPQAKRARDESVSASPPEARRASRKYRDDSRSPRPRPSSRYAKRGYSTDSRSPSPAPARRYRARRSRSDSVSSSACSPSPPRRRPAGRRRSDSPTPTPSPPPRQERKRSQRRYSVDSRSLSPAPRRVQQERSSPDSRSPSPVHARDRGRHNDRDGSLSPSNARREVPSQHITQTDESSLPRPPPPGPPPGPPPKRPAGL